jgi:aspartyl-tRNA(Asn)/glutamyl-tRNA(Gln) amidotransferase subunit A
MELGELTIKGVHQGLIRKDFSTLELTKYFLERIENFDKKICSYLTVTGDLALSQAKAIDVLISSGKEVPFLAGIPVAIKDNMLVDNVRCTAGSKILADYVAPYDATVVKKLKDQGVVILGKTNLDEFAMGSSGENSAFEPTKNPLDLEKVPGGSSAGSAAAVAGKLAIFSLGSDTGGSIRLPASFCGLVGFKPTYGAVSRYGLIAMASSLDQIGPITKTVEDNEVVFKTISGKDHLDSTSADFNFQEIEGKVNIKNIKIGMPKEYFVKGINPDIEAIVKNSIKRIEAAGAEIKEISLPHTEYALATYYIIMPSEVSANLARYDGIKYGYSVTRKNEDKSKDLLNVYLNSREDGFGDEPRRRIMLGTYALSSGYYDAYYLKAQKVRTLIKEDFEKVFKNVDFIITPTSPTLPFRIGERVQDPLAMYLSDILLVAVNLAGLPAISIPCGKIKNLPVGLQIIGQRFQENKIFAVSKIFEKILNLEIN